MMKKKEKSAVEIVLEALEKRNTMTSEELEEFKKKNDSLWRKWEAMDNMKYENHIDDGTTPLNECFYCGFRDYEEFWECPMCHYFRRLKVDFDISKMKKADK